MKEFVKKTYADIAKKKKSSCCGPTCCSDNNVSVSEKIGYSKEELALIPDEANMGLGCGNPVALASLKEGETVVDLGAGAGIDVFLASKCVGDKGRVIGIDMTEEMVNKARENARNGAFNNVEFKLGTIEDIPLEDSIADCIVSNCVINLSEDKQKVFNEAFRILKPGGRLMVSDMVLLRDLSDNLKNSSQLYASCISGALKREDYLMKVVKAGFDDVYIIQEDPVRISDYIGSDKAISDLVTDISDEDIKNIDSTVVSLKISAFKR